MLYYHATAKGDREDSKAIVNSSFVDHISNIVIQNVPPLDQQKIYKNRDESSDSCHVHREANHGCR